MNVREGYKWCPGCLEEIELDPIYWPTRRVKRSDGSFRVGPAGYCRRCKQKKEAKRQLDRRHGVPPKRANCDVCGRIKIGLEILSMEEEAMVDADCSEHLQRCDWSLENAMAILDVFLAHNAEEDAREMDWRANRRRPSHLGIDDPPFWNHAACQDETETWISVGLFLQRQEALRKASETSPWQRAALGDLR